MNSSLNCGLKGSYKVDIKNRYGEIVESTDWFDNDITNVGMNYPYYYSFARCFMFLSLGGTTIGGSRALYTGLPNPITGISVYDSNLNITYDQGTTYIGWLGYELGTPKTPGAALGSSTTCGTTFTNQGLNFYRGWTIPTGLLENSSLTLAQNVNINSLMLSPSSGGDPIGQYAFSLVDKQLTIPSGFSATITYQLSLSLPTYTNSYTIFQSYTSGGIFNYNNFTGTYPGNPNGWFNLSNATRGINDSETGLLALWGNLSGIYRQIYPGLELVGPLGECVVPVRGNNLEPYITNCPNLYFYLSPDMAQFGVNKFNAGGPATGEFGAYNSIGLASNYIEWVSNSSTGASPDSPFLTTNDTAFPSSPNDYYYSGINDPINASSLQGTNSQEVLQPTIENIRLNNLLSLVNYNAGAIPLSVIDYTQNGFINASNATVDYANAGVPINPTFTNYGNRAIVSTYLRELPNPLITSPLANTGSWGLGAVRTGFVNKQAFFPPISSLGTNSRYGSMTLGYFENSGPINGNTIDPYMDFIFFDTSGRIANMPHYRLIPWIYLTNRGSGVAQAIFSITGAYGSRPSSINRIWQAHAFMGPGINNASGLDGNHPMVQINSNGIADPLSNGNPTFIPAFFGNFAPSGYVFSGQVLNSNVFGDDGATTNNGNYSNGGTGWGAVYGVVASVPFYQSQIDCGLVDSPTWSGYTGTISGIPDATGTPLFWPITGTGNGLGVLVSGIQYYVKGYTDIGYGNLNDPTGFYQNGTYQLLGDISLNATPTATGSFFDIVDNTYGALNAGYTPGNDTYQAIYLTNSTTTSSSITLLNYKNYTVFPFISKGISFTGNLGNIVLYYQTGWDTNSNVAITGFTYTVGGLQSGRGSGRYWTANDIASLLISGSTTNTAYEVGTANGTPIYMTLWDGNTNNAYYALTGTTQLQPVASQLCAPAGIIQHFEQLNGQNGIVTGNRLLPNYALPNNQAINTYGPSMGGAFPGLSTENGMEVYLNFTWSG